MDLLRESAAGQTIRYVTRNKFLQYPEEKGDFHWAPLEAILADEKNPIDSRPGSKGLPNEKSLNRIESDSTKNNSDNNDNESEDTISARLAHVPTHSEVQKDMTRTSSQRHASERFDVEQNIDAQKTKSAVIAPTKTSDGNILVDWYATDDPANPQNWHAGKKGLVLFQLCIYSLAVYGASSMYVPGTEGVMEEFHVGTAPAALGLAIYVLGYGIGPLVFAPMSEIASIGRNWVYVPTFFIFVILSIPTALVKNYAGLLVLRFLTGFFGSPCLANGGASVGDMYSIIVLPVYLCAWTAGQFWGPAIGPIVASFAVEAEGWRWGLWEIVWLTAPIFVVFLFAYPETSADNILLRRAQRLRKLTGRDEIKSKSEIEQSHLKTSAVVVDALIKPIEIMVKDPAIAFANIYTSLIYGIYYSFFEAFPLVYSGIYGFSLSQSGLCFVTVGIGCLLGVFIFLVYQFKYLIPDIRKNGFREPEHRLVPAIFGVIVLPAAYFMFGWTARENVHWIVSLIGVTLLICTNFVIFQCVFVYLPISYPKYAASLFAANDLLRSVFAAGCVLFARPMFIGLGIGGGVSLLAGLSCFGIVGMYCLWKYGGWLRSRSTFAG